MTINEQIEAGASEIVLTEDVSENVVIPAGHEVTIDLAGFRLSNNIDAGNEYTITNYGDLTIIDSGETGMVFNDGTTQRGCMVNHKGGVVTVNGGTFEMTGLKWYYIVNLGDLMTFNGGAVNGVSPNTSTVRNGFYTQAERESDYDGKFVKMVINDGVFKGQLIPVKNDNEGDLEINGGYFEGPSECVLNWNMGRINGGTFKSPDNKYCIFSGSCAGEIGCNGKLDVTGGTFIGGAGIYDLTSQYDPEHEYPDAYSYITGGKWEVADKENVKSFIKPGYEAEIDEDGNIIVEKEVEWTFPQGGIAGMGFMNMKRVVMKNKSVEYEAGGFDLPVRNFMPTCIIGAMAKGGIDAYYNEETKKIQFYRNGEELSGQRIMDVTIVMIGQ